MIGRIISNLFPPQLPLLHPVDDLPETMEYQGRIGRRGVDRNPEAYTGVQIVAVREWPARKKFGRSA